MDKSKLIKGLYAITDSSLLPGDRLFGAVIEALEGGASIIQYRNKSADSSKKLKEAEQLLQICKQFRKPLIINDDVELAKTIGADGVHLGQEDGSIQKARLSLGKAAIIGTTCHGSIDLAMEAEDEGVDYVAFGRFFPSNSKNSAPPADLSVLEDAKKSLLIPSVAIGGINIDNAIQILETGCRCLAVIHGLFSTKQVREQAAEFIAIAEQYYL